MRPSYELITWNILHQFVWVTGSDAVSTDGWKTDCTRYHRLLKDMQHLAANIELPKHPQEVKYDPSLLANSLFVAFPVHSDVHVNTQVSVVISTFTTSCNIGLVLFLLKATIISLFCLGSRRGDCSHTMPQSAQPVPSTQPQWYISQLQLLEYSWRRQELKSWTFSCLLLSWHTRYLIILHPDL